MIKATSVALFILLITLTGAIALGVWGFFGLAKHAIIAEDSLADAAAKLNKTIDAVNAPCAGFHGSVSCGPIAQLSQTEKNIGILAGQATEQVKQSAQLVTTSAKAVQKASEDISGVAQHAQGTADAATGLLASAKSTTDTFPPLVGDIRAAVQGIPPIEAKASDALASFNALLNKKSLNDAIDGIGTTSQNVGKLSGDLYVYAHPFLNPDPCKTKKCTAGRVFGRVEALTGFGANLYQVSDFFRPLSVKVQK